MVYQHPERRGKTLPWKLRARLMCKLLAGDMGIDVLHAMRPQFELRENVGEIAGELVEEFKKTSAFARRAVKSNANAWSRPMQTTGRVECKREVRWCAISQHLTGTFKLSNDPHFEKKFWDVIGLYLDRPDKALVLCCDEKSQVQALERTQPGLLLGIGISERNRTIMFATARSPCSLRWTIFRDA